MSYYDNQQLPEAIKLDTDALRFINMYYQGKSNEWHTLKLSTINSLASSFT